MNPKVSIIIPVYNTNKEYFKTCMDSILNQTYSNIEVIIVDDGSINGIEKYCDEIKKSDSRIIVIHQKNQGVSVARNTGIGIATGEYVAFVDSDDIVTPFMVESAVETIKNNDADLALGLVKYIYESCEFVTNPNSEEYAIDSSEKVDVLKKIFFLVSEQNDLFDINWNGIICRGPYTKLIKTEVAKKIIFPKDIIYAEDAIWLTRLLKECKKIYIKNEAWYGYLQYDESSIFRYNENRIESFYSFLDILCEEEKEFLTKYPNVLVKTIYTEIIIIARYHFLSKECKLSFLEKVSCLKNVVNKFEKEYLKKFTNKYGLKVRMAIFIFKSVLWIPCLTVWKRIKNA